MEVDIAHFEIEDHDLGCFDIPFLKKKSLRYLTEAQVLKHKEAIREIMTASKDKGVK